MRTTANTCAPSDEKMSVFENIDHVSPRINPKLCPAYQGEGVFEK